ncbi:MAG: hypothetical protein IAF38_18150 [Bacteroidia bacterium]|nr:hypothetical protein [Bacteroidia bacterium]
MAMEFKQRLKFYGVGFVIGLIILIYITKCKSTNHMKVDELASQYKVFSKKAVCKLKGLGLNDTTFIKELAKYRVNYAKSEIHAKPCGIFVLEPMKPDSAMFNLTVCDCDTFSVIKDIDVFPKYKTNCDSVSN